jgi:hypothetical protein
MRTDAVREDGLLIMSQEKNEQPVFVPLPPVVIDLIGKLQPKSAEYFLDGHFDDQNCGQRLVGKDAAALHRGRYRKKAHS